MMKIARIRKSNRETYGLVRDGKIATKDDITDATAVPIPINVRDFLFDGWIKEIKEHFEKIPFKHDLSEFELLAPIPNPQKIMCLAFNYLNHAKEQNLTPPSDPVIVMKPRTALCGTTAEVICPNFVKELDYEIELAVILGKECKNISEENAYDAVFGYMILNDISARDIQFKDKQFTRAKSFDTFAPCGPWITTKDEIDDPHNLRLLTKINGDTRQDSSTKNMHLKIPQIISRLSKVMTLEPGDIISTGTPPGVGMGKKPALYLKPGDIMKLGIEGLGEQSQTTISA